MNHLKNFILFIFFFSFTLSLSAKTVIISDIDDTLKQSNSMGRPVEQAYHFFRKVPYVVMRDLYLEIKNDAIKRGDGIGFYYVSAAYSITFKADKWIDKNQFPQGRTVLKNINNKIPTYKFKYDAIKKILEQEIKNLDIESGEKLKLYMFGDNAQFDAQVYSDLKKELALNDALVFIRDVKAEATFFDSSIPVIKATDSIYYFSEIELLGDPRLSIISNELKEKTLEKYHRNQLIPKYTLKTLERRLSRILGDVSLSRDLADKFWDDYHHRY